MTTGTFLVAALAAAANAATLPQPKCCFAMTAYGGPGGTVGQLGDGQNRIGQNNLPVPQGTYCLNNGALTDSYGRGCIMTPPTGQLQCDDRTHSGLARLVITEGKCHFCPPLLASISADMKFSWNLYDRPVEGQKKCQPVWLVADSCYSECAPPPQTSSTKMSSSTKVSTTTKMSTSTKMSSTTKKTSSTTKMSSSTQPTPSISKSTSTTVRCRCRHPEMHGLTFSQCTTWTPSMSKPTQSTPCPSSSTPVTTSSKTSSSSTPCPTSSKPATTSMPYVCNPAHSYPNGATCISTMGSLTLYTPVPTTSSMAYACNPAHSYPNGATCISTMGSLTLYTPMPTTTKAASTSSMPSQQPPMSIKPANMPKGCPGKLGKDFEFPHQIIHINSAEPDKAYGNFFNGTMTSTISSMFNFDIPADAAGKTCSLEFMFPAQDQLETSAYTISGDGKANFYALDKPAHKSNTFNTSPKSDKYLGEYTLTPGSSSKIHSMACPAGKTIGIWMFSATGSSLNYFQDFNPCPIGLFMNGARRYNGGRAWVSQLIQYGSNGDGLLVFLLYSVLDGVIERCLVQQGGLHEAYLCSRGVCFTGARSFRAALWRLSFLSGGGDGGGLPFAHEVSSFSFALLASSLLDFTCSASHGSPNVPSQLLPLDMEHELHEFYYEARRDLRSGNGNSKRLVPWSSCLQRSPAAGAPSWSRLFVVLLIVVLAIAVTRRLRLKFVLVICAVDGVKAHFFTRWLEGHIESSKSISCGQTQRTTMLLLCLFHCAGVRFACFTFSCRFGSFASSSVSSGISLDFDLPKVLLVREFGTVIEQKLFALLDGLVGEKCDPMDSVDHEDPRIKIVLAIASVINEAYVVAEISAVDFLNSIERKEVTQLLFLIDSPASFRLLFCDDLALVFANKVMLPNGLPSVQTKSVNATLTEECPPRTAELNAGDLTLRGRRKSRRDPGHIPDLESSRHIAHPRNTSTADPSLASRSKSFHTGPYSRSNYIRHFRRFVQGGDKGCLSWVLPTQRLNNGRRRIIGSWVEAYSFAVNAAFANLSGVEVGSDDST
ncbi:hypothetical protein KC363_g222 [Hortaea werneckii]|nr:hypothetical protein KC363_g222 [Hortaea werneckii]